MNPIDCIEVKTNVTGNLTVECKLFRTKPELMNIMLRESLSGDTGEGLRTPSRDEWRLSFGGWSLGDRSPTN